MTLHFSEDMQEFELLVVFFSSFRECSHVNKLFVEEIVKSIEYKEFKRIYLIGVGYLYWLFRMLSGQLNSFIYLFTYF